MSIIQMNHRPHQMKRIIILYTTPEGFFNNPQHDRTKLFLSQIWNIRNCQKKI